MESRKLNIGLLISNVEDDFPNMICKGAIAASSENGDNLYIIPGKYLDLVKYDDLEQFEYQYNVMFSYALSDKLDFLIISLGSIANTTTKEREREFLHLFDNKPSLIVAADAEGYVSVKYNNKSGIKSYIKKLLEAGKTRIAMFSGSMSNVDAVERLEAYMESLEEAGIPIEPKRIVSSETMSSDCYHEAYSLLDQNPDIQAVMCCNDAMAIAMYKAAAAKGLKVGEDICIIGFDDIPDAETQEPPLATVKADPAELAYAAVNEGRKMFLNGELISYNAARLQAEDYKLQRKRSIIVNTNPVMRESAGVRNRKTIDKEKMLKEQNERIKHLINMNHNMNIILRDMLSVNDSDSKGKSMVIDKLYLLGISNSFLYYHDKPVLHRKTDIWRKPEGMRLIYKKQADESSDVVAVPEIIDSNDIFCNQYTDTEKAGVYLLIDLFLGEYQFGLLMCDLNYNDFHYAEAICYSISMVVKILELLRKQSDIMSNLEESNYTLSRVSVLDELTGICNRRGFYRQAEDILKKNAGNSNLVIIYADMDYLKKINDRYGHDEGDFAIKKCSQILSDVLGNDAAIGRIGGDEFAGLVSAENRAMADTLVDRINHTIVMYNNTKEKPYRISVSVGAYIFENDNLNDIKELLGKADLLLYERKREKKARAGNSSIEND